MATKTKSPLSLNIQHSYITLKTPNGNFTTSYGGAKASGNLATDGDYFTKLDKYVQKQLSVGRNVGDAMNDLLDPNTLSSLWPNWNKPVPKNDFKEGDTITFLPSSLFNKKYPNGGVVKRVSRKNLFVVLNDTKETYGFDYLTMVKK